MADHVGAPLPEAVGAGALQAYAASVEIPVGSDTGIAERRAVSPSSGWLGGLGDMLSGLLRLPVLVPVGVAAGAVFMMTVQDTWRGPMTPSELSRSTGEQELLRVTSPQARVWTAPTTRSKVLATVAKGTPLRVAAMDRHWYQVVLPEGQVGWVERDAFE